MKRALPVPEVKIGCSVKDSGLSAKTHKTQEGTAEHSSQQPGGNGGTGKKLCPGFGGFLQ